MAENKKSFILYADLINQARKLPRELLGDLFITILEYVNDLDPDTANLDLAVEVTFEGVKTQLKRDLIKYEDKKLQWSEAGKRSAESRKAKKLERPSTDSTAVERPSTDSTVNDSVNVTVSDSVNDSKKKKKPLAKPPDFIDSIFDVFCDEYSDNRKTDFEKLTAGKERKAIGALLKLHKEKEKLNGAAKNATDTLKDFRNLFKDCLNIKDKFHYDKMSPNHIYSNWNQLKIMLNPMKEINELAEFEKLIDEKLRS
jgi:hypothetical protein